MIGKHAKALVVDWGLACPIKQSISTEDNSAKDASRFISSAHIRDTVAGTIVGTPSYMSPEQAAGEIAKLGPSSDVYSLGATLYFLLTGHPPVHGNSVAEILAKVKRGLILPPRTYNLSIPKPLAAICLKALSLNPDQRYSSPRELADDIDKWLADEPTTALKMSLHESVLWRFRKRSELAPTLIANFLLTAVLIPFWVIVETLSLRGRQIASDFGLSVTDSPISLFSYMPVYAQDFVSIFTLVACLVLTGIAMALVPAQICSFVTTGACALLPSRSTRTIRWTKRLKRTSFMFGMALGLFQAYHLLRFIFVIATTK